MPENSNIYNSLFPNGASQGGMYQTFNSGGYSNILNNGSSTNIGSSVSDAIGGSGSGLNFNTIGTLANIGAGLSKDVQTKSALGSAGKGASLGMKIAGPYGAALGFIGGGIIGAVEGKEQQKKIDHYERNLESTPGVIAQMQSNIKDSQSSVSDFWQGQKNATENAYSVGHIDNFLQKNRV